MVGREDGGEKAKVKSSTGVEDVAHLALGQHQINWPRWFTSVFPAVLEGSRCSRLSLATDSSDQLFVFTDLVHQCVSNTGSQGRLPGDGL